MKAPIPVQDVHGGRVGLARDLERVLRGRTLTDLGWAQENDLALLVPLYAQAPDGVDAYLLRLVFDHYPKWPPSVQFINPLTRGYDKGADRRWLPMSEGHPEIAFHADYQGGGQLVCSSTTLEFYKVQHEVNEAHLWREGMTFMATIAAIRSGVASPYYKGRHPNA